MDCINYSWERVQSNSLQKPQSRDSHTCVKLQNKLYFYGGSCNDKIFSDLWEFDLEVLEWKQIEVDPALEAREGHSAVTLTDRLMYIYGGWDSEKNLMQNNHWLFDSETLLFLQIQNVNGEEIPKRESHSSTLVGDKVYTFGGQGQNVGKNN